MGEPLPTGPLLWGQAGVFDAIDDRMLVTALAAGTLGLVRQPVLTPGAGLTVNIGRWHGIADCGDGTSAVIGTRDTQSVDVPAGGGASRVDVIFADLDVDAGTWTADLYTEAEAATRAGLVLGRVTVPAGANSAAQFDLRPAVVALARVRGVNAIGTDPLTATAPLRKLANLAGLEVQAQHRYWFRFQGVVFNGAAANNLFIVMGHSAGGAGAAGFRANIHFEATGAAPATGAQVQTSFNIETGLNSATLTGNRWWAEIEGYFLCAVDGEIFVMARPNIAGAPAMTVQDSATLMVADITAGAAPLVVAPEAPGEPGRIIR